MRNPRTVDIDQLSTVDILRTINTEDSTVATAVAQCVDTIATLVDLAVEAADRGARVHYVGAGTSGRLAVLDAAELVPTFNVPEDLVIAHHAGGDAALRHALENVEDDETAGAEAIRGTASADDVVIGLAASGRTPYVMAALRAARSLGARTALISANPGAAANSDVDVAIAVDTGAEVIAGSTRMKAGSAQKMVLNAFSTALMIRLGYTYSNLMVSMVASNAKLRGRSLRILGEATGASEAECSLALEDAQGEVRPALVALLTGTDSASARDALVGTRGRVRDAIEALATR